MTDDWLTLNAENESNNYGVGGTPSWYGLFRVAEIVAESPTHVIVEYGVNDSMYNSLGTDREGGWWACSEAFILRLREELPDAKLIFVCLTKQEEYTDAAHITARDNWIDICDKYDVEIHRIDLWLQEVLGTTTPTEEQINTYHDGAHFFEAGHAEIFNMLEANSLTENYLQDHVEWTGDLGDYEPAIYDSIEDLLEDPITRVGTDNDGETGTGWADNGTARVSSTADDTIQWTGEFSSFGIDVTVQASQITFAWSLDGGAYTNVNHQTGQSNIRELYMTDRDNHTVTIKVVSGTVEINAFMAI